MKKYLILFASVFLTDVITKWGVLRWCPSEVAVNKGVAWSLFHSSVPLISWLVIILVMAFISFFIFYTVKQVRSGASLWGEVFVLGGALANLSDRFLYGGVVDFIQIGFCGYMWPIFNIADIAIVTGAALMFWKGLRS